MIRGFVLSACVMTSVGLSSGSALAQDSRASVSGGEVTGTFKHAFTGKFRGSSSDIKILALGKGKLKVSFDLIYPFVDGTGQLEANVGQADGTATINGDTALFTSGDNGECRITIKFVRAGVINVSQEGDSSGCGFGFNVSADGTYKKASSARPKFSN